MAESDLVVDKLLELLDNRDLLGVKLEDSFICEVKNFIKRLEEVVSNEEDDFKRDILEDKLRTTKVLYKKLITLRTAKVVHLALREVLNLEKEEGYEECMHPDEKALYESVKNLLEEHLKKFLD